MKRSPYKLSLNSPPISQNFWDGEKPTDREKALERQQEINSRRWEAFKRMMDERKQMDTSYE